LPHLGYAQVSMGDTCAAINAATFLTVMLETPTAIANAARIAAVPGIDSLLIGTSDLSIEMGIPGQLGHERIVEAYRTVIAACRAHNKHPGMGGVYEPELMRRYIGMGMRYLLTGSDLGFMASGARECAKALRALL
jgi:2-keto-3-deoxy-L-rhamnonate aldolase RhmA